MADNIVANPGAGGETLATDDIGGVQFPRTKLVIGADGVNDGDVSASNPLPVTSASLSALASAVKIEDTASASGDPGVVILAQRRDTDASAADADGDYVTLKMDEAGRLKVAVQPASYPLTTGNITSATSTVPVNVARVSNVMVYVAGTFAGVNFTFEGSLNSTNGTDGNWFTVQAVRSNANTIETASGVLGAPPAYGWELSVNGLNWFRVRATAWTSGTATIQIQPGAYATEPIPAAQISGTQPVSFTQPALVAGAALIGDVGIQVRANATGAASIHHIVSAATTNVAQIKATAGRIYGYCLSNTTATWQYLKLHNVASATAGSGVVMTVGLPPNGKAECSIPSGIAFATAISRSIVTGAADADATATTLNAVVGDIFFA